MKLFVKRVIILFAILSATDIMQAKEYSVRKGQTMTLYCTATAPAGTITHAFFQLVNNEDAEYLGIAYSSSDQKATLYGLKAKSRIPIEVTYSYSYRGTYDNNMHVGSGSYTDYITVTGPQEATSIKIKEKDPVKIAPGQSATLHIEFYPTGSEGSVDWGFLDVMGQPYCFDAKYASNGHDFIVTGKKEGSVYVLALLNGDQTTAQVIQVVCSADAIEKELPSSIDISPSKLTMNVGDSQNLNVNFDPESSYSNLTWSSSNSSIATVDEYGKVTAVSAGKVYITAKTENNISAKTEVSVLPAVSNFSIDSKVSMTLGYSYRLTPKAYPDGALPKYRYKSSDESVVKVSSTGLITSIKEGTAKITISCDGVDGGKTVDVTVEKAVAGCDYRDARIRVQAIKSLFNQSVINK